MLNSKKFKTALFFLLLFTRSQAFSQLAWEKVTDPQNAVSQYTTIYPYVGASFADVNNDNLPDLVVSPRTLFINTGNGNFILSNALNFNFLVAIAGSSLADIDNDGDNDCIIACTPSRVFLNDGTGIFINAGNLVPGLSAYGSWACAAGNADNNSSLDIIFTHANGFHPPYSPQTCKLYFQPDTSVFSMTENTSYPFSQSFSSYTNPFWSDYDLDGDMDLFISNGPANGSTALDLCYKNLLIETGNDTLVRMTSELFAQQQQDGQCYNFIDFDNDGDLDLCLTNYFSAPTRLYLNTGGTYSVLSTPFSTATTNIANCWGDYDNDGDLDVIITNDNDITRYYQNNGNGTFTFLSGGLTTQTAVCSVTNCDYDNDGDLDVFINGIGNIGNTSSVGLYQNLLSGSGLNWVNIKLTGTISNKSSLGAIVRVKANINGSSVSQMREVNAQNTFQGQNDLRVHFGLGDAQIIDSLEIRWPNGLRESYANVSVKEFYNAVEGQGLNPIMSGINIISSEVPDNFILYQNYPNPFNPSTNLEFEISQLGFVTLKIYDMIGKEIMTLINTNLTPGTYKYKFDASSLPGGVYFYKLSSGNFSNTKKMVVLK